MDKIPYGTYVAFENLSYIFPDADINVNHESPSAPNSYIRYHTYFPEVTDTHEKSALYIIITPDFRPSKEEYETLMQFIGRGNHVFISSFRFGREFSDSLKVNIANYYPFREDDSLKVSVFHPFNTDSFQYTYPGFAGGGFFHQFDSLYGTILGKAGITADYIRQRYTGGGSLFLHTDPMALTNFFLLHKQNKSYYDNIFSYLPDNINHIEWDEYFRYGRKKFNALQVIFNNNGLRAAFWLTLLIFAIIYFFESKRRQRIIPIRQQLRNSSLDFVKTVGILYYQYRDNKNLAMKMSAHLWDHIRRRYNLTASTPDERFIENLAFKSGYDKQKLNNMLYQAKMMNDLPFVSDKELIEFHKQIEDFYKL